VATARSIYAPNNWSQQHQRRYQLFTDDHGREWGGNLEVKTGDVVGLLEPQFTAPLIPDQKYLERVDRRPYDLHINYKRWKADIRNGRRDWEREGRQLMRKMRGKAYNPSEEFGEDVLDVIGEPPQALEPIIAAEQENSWILGKTKRPDKRLVKFFEPEQLDEDYVKKEIEPDYSDLDEEHDPAAAGRHRQRVKSNKPEPRQATRGTGRRKGHPPHATVAAGGKGKRERYPKGHPRAGQYMPLEMSA
jgi:hypothetical protein